MRILLTLLIAIQLIGCGGKKLPSGVLEPAKMESVLWDMLQADEFLKDYMLNKDSTLNDTTEQIKMYERVFQLNKVSRAEFNTSYNYYRTHPDLFKKILDSLHSNRSQVPGELYKEGKKMEMIPLAIDSSIVQKSDTNSSRKDSSRLQNLPKQ